MQKKFKTGTPTPKIKIVLHFAIFDVSSPLADCFM